MKCVASTAANSNQCARRNSLVGAVDSHEFNTQHVLCMPPVCSMADVLTWCCDGRVESQCANHAVARSWPNANNTQSHTYTARACALTRATW
jgi:hypothetical protein